MAPAQHPLARSIAFGPCAACEGTDVLVLAAQYAVHPMNGDVYYDYELFCRKCSAFTQCSFADND